VTVPDHDKYLQAMQAALRMLRLRDRTEAELAQALTTRGFGEPELGLVLQTLRESRYVDDERIAERTVELSASDPKGRALLEQWLRSRGTDDGVVDQALEALADETTLAEASFEHHRKPGDTPARAAARLARKGFDEDTIRAVIERHFPEFD
jgi:regulatory protein